MSDSDSESGVRFRHVPVERQNIAPLRLKSKDLADKDRRMAYAVIGSIFCFFDMVAYVCTLGPLWTLTNSFRTAPKIVNVNGKEDSARRRDYCVSGLLESPNPNENVTTLTDVLLNSARKFADRPCFGTRDYLGELTEADPAKGQRFKPKHFGATTWLTYSQVQERVECFGAGLRNL